MRLKTLVLVLLLLCLCAATTAGFSLQGPSGLPAATTALPQPASTIAAETPANTPTLTPTIKASLSPTLPTPTLTPIPSQTPTPTPSPTPTPDPWAKFFSPAGPYLSVRDPVHGPWIYKDETLSVTVTIPKKGLLAGQYLRADVYTRGPVPWGGFANPARASQTALPYKIARQNKAVLAMTADYITCGYNQKGVMMRKGKVFYNKKDAPTLAFLPSGEMKVYEPGKITAKQLLALGVKESFAFGPILVKGGKVHPSVAGHRLNYRAFRAAIGQVEPGHLVLIVTLRSPTLTEIAKVFVQAKCKIAYNLDGGYSAAMVFMGEQLNKNTGNAVTQRALPDMLIIGTSRAVPGVKAPVYGNGISLNKKYRPKPVEGLIR